MNKPRHLTHLLRLFVVAITWHPTTSIRWSFNGIYTELPTEPSRELTYPTLGKGKSFSIYLGWGYVSFQEGTP